MACNIVMRVCDDVLKTPIQEGTQEMIFYSLGDFGTFISMLHSPHL